MNQVVFWGTRGSLPVALTHRDIREKVVAALTAANGKTFKTRQALDEFVDQLPFATNGTFGGNSACVEIVGDGAEHFICDMGSGARPLGQAKIAKYGVPNPQTYHIFISHLHWDHLMGFPYFAPMYIPGNRIVVHGCHPQLEASIREIASQVHHATDTTGQAVTAAGQAEKTIGVLADAVGKIGDIFSMRGIGKLWKGKSDLDLFDHLDRLGAEAEEGSLTFANFVEFDSLYGHPRDVAGYARALEWFDARAGAFLAGLRPGDLAIFTADHGNAEMMFDPGSNQAHTQHTTNLVPLMFIGRNAQLADNGALSDLAPTLLHMMGLKQPVEMSGKTLLQFKS